MKRRSLFSMLALVIALSSYQLWNSDTAEAATPVNPNASVEAREVLNYIAGISGTNVLSGQHDYSNNQTNFFDTAYDITDKYAAVWATDLGFDAIGLNDTMFKRDVTVNEAIAKWSQGSLVTLTWHMCSPTVSAPCNWESGVQGIKLTDQQWIDITTPGTSLYDSFIARIDEAVPYLTELRDAHVPVLWRPFHEMDGGWFWWGYNTTYSEKLFQIMYDRYVNTYGLNNLIWVWNVNYQQTDSLPYADFFPGSSYVDILSVDVYHNLYGTNQYNDLVALAAGKPIALTEVGELPSAAVLTAQPLWAYVVEWAQYLTGNNTTAEVQNFYNDSRVINQDETQIGPFKDSGTTTIDDAWAGTGLHYFNYSGSWSTSSGAGKYKGSDHSNSTTHSYYTVDFKGTQAALYASKAQNHGIAAVSIDGGAETDVDFYAPTSTENTLIWTSAVLPDGPHTVKVRVKGTKNASSAGYKIAADRIVISADNSAPSAPTNLTSPSKTDTTVNLSWTASTDNIGVTGYQIYSGKRLVGTTSGATTYTVTGLDPSIPYSFKVRAKDARNNVSASSNVIALTTNVPSAGTLYEAETAQLTGVTTANLKPGFSGTGYVEASSFDAIGDKIHFTISVPNAGTYNLKIRYAAGEDKTQFLSINNAADDYVVFPSTGGDFASLNFGDISLQAGSNTLTLSKYWGWMDVDRIHVSLNTQAPSNLASPSKTDTTVNLSWSAPIDNAGVTGYQIFRGESLVGTTSGATTYTVTGLDPSILYSFKVRATDANSNVSAPSNVIALTTNAPSSGTIYEAEDAQLTGVSAVNQKLGFSGTGYVQAGTFDETGDNIRFTVTVSTAGTYNLKIRYAANEDKTQYLSINNGADTNVVFPNTGGSFETLNYGNVSLQAGSNTITLGKNWGWMDVDRIQVSN